MLQFQLLYWLCSLHCTIYPYSLFSSLTLILPLSFLSPLLLYSLGCCIFLDPIGFLKCWFIYNPHLIKNPCRQHLKHVNNGCHYKKWMPWAPTYAPMIFRLQLHIWNINKNILGVPFSKKNASVCVIDLKEYKAKLRNLWPTYSPFWEITEDNTLLFKGFYIQWLYTPILKSPIMWQAPGNNRDYKKDKISSLLLKHWQFLALYIY